MTPHDSTNMTIPAKFLYVGTGGNVVVIGWDGVSTTWTNVQSGSYIWASAKRVNSTNTTASNIIGIR